MSVVEVEAVEVDEGCVGFTRVVRPLRSLRGRILMVKRVRWGREDWEGGGEGSGEVEVKAVDGFMCLGFRKRRR